MSTPARYGLALLLLPVFVLTAAAWLAWRIVRLAWRAVVHIPDMLAWALRVVLLSTMLVGLVTVIGLVAMKVWK